MQQASLIVHEVIQLCFLDFDVRVNLYNRLNERCENTSKGRASIRKNGIDVAKQIPPPFKFSANPSVFYLQVRDGQ